MAFPLVELLLSSEYPHLLTRGLLFGFVGGGVFVAWSVAHFVMVWHQDSSSSVSTEDVSEWHAREDIKGGGIIPFAYLLASPEQRRVRAYLGYEGPPEKTRHWYSRRR